MTLRVFGWTADNSGCAWYRVLLPLGMLNQDQKIEATWGPRFEEQDWDCDVLVAQRCCLPGPTGIIRRLTRTGAKRPKIVLEIDDDLLSIDRHNKISRDFYATADIRANLVENLQVADLVTVSTDNLAEVVSKWNDNVVVLPNYIPTDPLYWQPGCWTDRVTLGWQGSPTHNGDWAVAARPVQQWFRHARQRGLNVEMHTVGSVPETFPQVRPHRVTKWREAIHEYYHLLDWHIALAPLADSRFNRSKSHIRVLEAAMLGFPVIASNVDAYAGFVRNGETGFLVDSADEWIQALEVLTQNPSVREKMGAAAREHARQYTIEGNADRWLEAYTR